MGGIDVEVGEERVQAAGEGLLGERDGGPESGRRGRGQRAVGPVAVQAGRAVEERWSQVVGAERLEQLRETLVDLLTPPRRA